MRFVFAAAMALVPLASASADGFDGYWRAMFPWASSRCPATQVDATVSGSDLRANLGYIRFHGTLNADGTTFTLPGGDGFTLNGKFEGDRMSVWWDGNCGHRSATGGRQS